MRLARRYPYLTALLLVIGAGFFSFASASERDRGRPRIENNTLVTDQSTRMRGGTFWLYGWITDRLSYAQNSNAWSALTANRLNAVRLSCAYRPSKTSNLSLDEYAVLLDDLLDRAARAGVYVVIDYHPKPGTYAMPNARAFWKRFAPRYRNRTHVIYELINEPVSWAPSDYQDKHLRDFEELWRICNSAAPETPIIILSFAHVGRSGATPLDVANRLRGIDWTKTLVGFHGYWRTSSDRIKQLKAAYPVVNTEFMMISGPEMRKMDGFDFQATLMETLGISWFQWDLTSRSSEVSQNLPLLVNDLKSRGLYWTADDDQAFGTDSSSLPAPRDLRMLP